MDFPQVQDDDNPQFENFEMLGGQPIPNAVNPQVSSNIDGFTWAENEPTGNKPEQNLYFTMDNPLDEEEEKRIAARRKEEEERRQKIVQKMNEEIRLKQEWRDKAKDFIENYQQQRETAIEQRKKFNISNEQANLQNRALMKEGKKNPWEKVMENISLKESDYKGTKDVARMRNVIMSRKNDFVPMKMK